MVIKIPVSSENQFKNIMQPSHKNWKKDVKQDKGSRKQEGVYFTRKEIEQQMRNLEQDKNDHQNQDPNYRRALRWWRNIDERYFQTLSLQDAIAKSTLTTSNQIMAHGNTQSTPMLNYVQEYLQPFFPSLNDSNKIKVLFKSLTPYYSALVSFSLEQAIPNYHTETSEGSDPIKITSINKKNSLNEENESTKNSHFNNQSQIKNIRLDMDEMSENELLCSRVEKISEMDKNCVFLDEIDKQIELWQWELQRVNQENHIAWNQLISKIQCTPASQLQVRNLDDYEGHIRRYQDKILWGTILRCFQQGFKDKTDHMFKIYKENQQNFNKKPPKGIKTQNKKKYFQTDCKICFCSDNSQSNQVIYCDGCNTSFHLACYGLTVIPKQDPYYCERCKYLKLIDKKVNTLSCQICSKTCFPMKRYGDHFYHVTCLVLFNMVEIREGKMELKGSLSHRNITKMVIQNELDHEDCEGCRKSYHRMSALGMQIKCSATGCSNSFHPICGYLNGCKISLKKNADKSLQVNLHCNAHLGSRMNQIYLRRYMCNLNGCSFLDQCEYKEKIQQQMDGLQRSKKVAQGNRKKYLNINPLMCNKYISNMLKPKRQKSKQKNSVEGSQVQKMLRQLKKKG